METKEVKKKFDLGPGAIAKSSMDSNIRSLIFGSYDMAPVAKSNDPDFILSNEGWLTIQCYVTKTLALPNTEEKFKTFLGVGAPSDLTDFSQLITAYNTMNKHVTDWKKTTFPKSVSLASDIYNYSLKVDVYYKPIPDLAEELTINPEDKNAKDKLTAILSTLSRLARNYQDKAAKVAKEVADFADFTEEDQIKLSGPDSGSGLIKYYEDKYGATSDEARTIANNINAMQAILQKANEEYNHDVTVASTTPTYCWVVPPLGLIAAAIVAGIYGDKAVKALDSIRAYEKKLKDLRDEEQANANLLLILNATKTGLADISKALNEALPLIQKIQGAWQGIADSLDDIVKTIQENIQEALPIIMDLGVQSAIKSWKAVGQSADKYRQNAYITVRPA